MQPLNPAHPLSPVNQFVTVGASASDAPTVQSRMVAAKPERFSAGHFPNESGDGFGGFSVGASLLATLGLPSREQARSHEFT